MKDIYWGNLLSRRRDLNPSACWRTVYPSTNLLVCLVSRDRDLNPGPSVYKTDALPLSYLGKQILQDPELPGQILTNLAG